MYEFCIYMPFLIEFLQIKFLKSNHLIFIKENQILIFPKKTFLFKKTEKMFIFGLLVVSGSAAVNLALDRLQNQMVNMLNGTEFDGFPGNAARNEIDFNTFKYGCHCRFDKSMQQMGRGEPVDAIDSACKVYKVSSEFKGQLKVKLFSVMFEVRA